MIVLSTFMSNFIPFLLDLCMVLQPFAGSCRGIHGVVLTSTHKSSPPLLFNKNSRFKLFFNKMLLNHSVFNLFQPLLQLSSKNQ